MLLFPIRKKENLQTLKKKKDEEKKLGQKSLVKKWHNRRNLVPPKKARTHKTRGKERPQVQHISELNPEVYVGHKV